MRHFISQRLVLLIYWDLGLLSVLQKLTLH